MSDRINLLLYARCYLLCGVVNTSRRNLLLALMPFCQRTFNDDNCRRISAERKWIDFFSLLSLGANCCQPLLGVVVERISHRFVSTRKCISNGSVAQQWRWIGAWIKSSRSYKFPSSDINLTRSTICDGASSHASFVERRQQSGWLSPPVAKRIESYPRGTA